MDERAARAWIHDTFDVPRETMARLDAFVVFLAAEGQAQNLVSRASMGQVWLRHMADSAQLLKYSPSAAASWIDLGSGAGFPGLVVAALHEGPTTLVEARTLRVDFLRRAAAVLGVERRIEVVAARVERLAPRHFDVISARAFAPLARLLELGTRFSTAKTRWILPKGRNARSELDAVSRSWQGDFTLEQSMTDPDAGIIVAERVKKRT
jgi:16S rRNA (guanine527-N7)-methyltransferase